jgi:hypothetical protein
VFPTIATALDPGRDVTAFADRLEREVAQRLAAAPEQMQIPLAHLVLFKRPKSQ